MYVPLHLIVLQISPVVSDTSGDENAREEYREPISLSTSRQLSNEPQEVIKLVRKLNNIKNIQNNYQVEGPAQENADCESTSDTHTIVESTSDSTVTVTPASILQPLEYPINILKIDHGDDLEHPSNFKIPPKNLLTFFKKCLLNCLTFFVKNFLLNVRF